MGGGRSWGAGSVSVVPSVGGCAVLRKVNEAGEAAARNMTRKQAERIAKCRLRRHRRRHPRESPRFAAAIEDAALLFHLRMPGTHRTRGNEGWRR